MFLPKQYRTNSGAAAQLRPNTSPPPSCACTRPVSATPRPDPAPRPAAPDGCTFSERTAEFRGRFYRLKRSGIKRHIAKGARLAVSRCVQHGDHQYISASFRERVVSDGVQVATLASPTRQDPSRNVAHQRADFLSSLWLTEPGFATPSDREFAKCHEPAYPTSDCRRQNRAPCRLSPHRIATAARAPRQQAASMIPSTRCALSLTAQITGQCGTDQAAAVGIIRNTAEDSPPRSAQTRADFSIPSGYSRRPRFKRQTIEKTNEKWQWQHPSPQTAAAPARGLAAWRIGF